MYIMDIVIINTDENEKKYIILPDIDEDEYEGNYIEDIYQYITTGLESLNEDEWEWKCIGPEEGSYCDDQMAFYLNKDQIQTLYKTLCEGEGHHIINMHENEISNALCDICESFETGDD